MFKNIQIDQHDLFGLIIILASIGLVIGKVIDGTTFIGALGVASGLILASNIPILAGKANDTATKP